MRILFLLLSLLICNETRAGVSLKDACERGSQLTLLTSQTVANYNFAPLLDEKMDMFDVRFGGSTHWYSIAVGNPNYESLKEVVKIARITGEQIDACVNQNGDWLIGLEWTVGTDSPRN